MDWQLLLDYIRVLIWPAVVVTLLVIFRAKVGDLIDHVSELGGGGVSVKFKREAKEIISASRGSAQGRVVWSGTAEGTNNPQPVETVRVTLHEFNDVDKVITAVQEGKEVDVSVEPLTNETGLVAIGFFSGYNRGTGGKMKPDDSGVVAWKHFKMLPPPKKSVS